MCVLSLSLLIGLTLPHVTPAQSKATNLDFEDGGVGSPPPGWFVPTAGYRARLVDQRPHEGKQCVLLESDEEAANTAPFGNIMQTIDAEPYRGKRVRLRAAIRISPAGASDRAQMWFRVDRQGRKRGFFNNMGDSPIRSRQWKYYEIEGDIDDDAVAINFGVMLLKQGRVWLDDVSLEVVGEAQIAPVEPPRRLRGRARLNLIAFTKLLGYVRYFHPSDEAAGANWEDFAIAGVRKVESAKNTKELARVLEEYFRPIAPTVRVFPRGKQPPIPDELKAPAHDEPLRVCTWRHLGVGTGGATQSAYRSWRDFKKAPAGQTPDGIPDPATPFVAYLGGGVSCMVPRALFADEAGTRPHDGGHASDQSSSKKRYSGDDRAVRLAAVALCWNVFQHFYPYFDVVETDWKKALRSALTSAATDGDELAFLYTLRRMVVELHDGHGNVWHRSDPATATLPILWDWVEDRLVVTAVAESALGGAELQRGNVVRKINGRDAADALADAEKLISGSPQWRRYRGLQTLRTGAPQEEVTLLIDDNGNTRTVTLKRTGSMAGPVEPRPAQLAELKPGIYYVDISRLKDGEFTKALARLKKARGLVIDFRGYPRAFTDTLTILGHLTDETMTCAQWHIPKVSEPDRKNVEFQFSNWPVAPQAPRLTAKVAFITDGRAISAAETIMGIVEHYGLGEIIGSPTAGTNGNVNPFELPGGYRIAWTGMKVLKHDGSQHHLIGIQPTVPVSRTVRAIAEGRDELLERAVAAVSGKP